MRAFHDSRDAAYRAPRGAVVPGTSVNLAIDVADAPKAQVTLRTWTDGVGERLYPMHERDLADEASQAVRYEATLAPDAAGIVWYQFVIDDGAGNVRRYGVPDGRRGGTGQLYDWEPPSFQLTVLAEAQDRPAGTEDVPAEPEGGAGLGGRIAEFLRNGTGAPALAQAIEELCESRPWAGMEAQPIALEPAGKLELIAYLAGLEDGISADLAADGTPEALDEGKRGLAKGRLWCASLIQMLVPGEARTLWDRREPTAPGPLPWQQDEIDCQTIIDNARDLRDSLPLFTEGAFSCYALSDNVLGIWRRGKGDAACLLVNASLEHTADVGVPLAGAGVSEVISGYAVPVSADADGAQGASVHLHQLGTALLYFHDGKRLAQPTEEGIGVLAHVTSLPAVGHNAGEREVAADADGASLGAAAPAGTLGAPARAFIDRIAMAGARYWQVLPVNPTDEFGSPYAGISAFAGNPLLLERHAEGGSGEAADGHAKSDAATLGQAALDQAAFDAFCETEEAWLGPYSCFMAIRAKVGEGIPWQDWPERYRRYSPDLLTDSELADTADACRREQFAFQCQWQAVRAYANERGVQIIGDMPIYVSADSADVWAHPEIFQLDQHGMPRAVAGCPPDAFAEDGQIWGNPLYDWDRLEQDGFGWWLQRLARAFELYDYVRLDHFIGFARYFAIPVGRKATAGTYRPGPGMALFEAAYGRFGALPVIAEDLGLITPAVRALVAGCGFPGMDIVQFADGNDPLSGYAPRPEKIAYTGTHDNQTLAGYAEERYPHLDPRATATDLLRKVAACGAPVRIFPLQDLMGLGDEARMNTPGTSEGNWTWRAPVTLMDRALETLRKAASA